MAGLVFSQDSIWPQMVQMICFPSWLTLFNSGSRGMGILHRGQRTMGLAPAFFAEFCSDFMAARFVCRFQRVSFEEIVNVAAV
jgi:hypothetical protein